MATPEQLHEAIRRADAAGDAEAVKALAAALKEQSAPPVEEEGLAGGVTYEGPNNWQQLGAATQSAAAGAAQGVAGIYDFAVDVANVPTQALNMATRGIANVADYAGADSLADFLRRGANNYDRDLGRVPSVSDLIEQASPTPQGMEGARFGAQLLGGMAVPLGPKAAPRIAAPPATAPASGLSDLVEAGQREGVRVMTSDAKPPKTFLGKFAQATGERIPIAGTAGPRAAQQNERIEAVKNLAADFGADVAGDQLNDVAQDFAKTRGAKVSGLAARKNAIIEGTQGAVPAPRAIAAIDQQIARLSGINADAYAPVIAKLENFKEQLGRGASLAQVEGNRKLLGDLFADPSLASIKGDGQKALNAIYAPLRDDMGEFIKQTAGDAAYSTWTRTNRELAVMAGELNVSSFRRILNSSEATPEDVGRLLFSNKPSDVRRLVGNLSPAGKAKAQAAIIQRALAKAGEDTSPDKFASEIGRLGKQIGVAFDGQDASRIEGMRRLLEKTQRAATASVAPPTGVQNTPIVGGFAAGSLLGWAAVPYAAAVGLLARAYESAPVRNMLLGLSKTKPGTPAESNLLERILKAATSQAEIRAPANDTLGASLAAGQPEEQQ